MRKRTQISVILISLIATSIFCFVLLQFPINYVHDFLALLLTAFAGLHLVPAISEKKTAAVISEIIIFLLIFSAAIFGLYLFLPILAIGFLLYAIWNIIQYFSNIGANISKSIALSLVTINFVLCTFIIFFFVF